MLTITDVVLSSDRKQAKVYLSFYGVKKDSDTITNAINDNAYRFQSLLGSSLKLKRTPVLKFFKKGHFDDSLNPFKMQILRPKNYIPVNGILLLDKGSDMTSNTALQLVKNVYKAKKAGHTGTLDFLASGLLPICFGEATKVSQFILNSDKTYYAEILFGYQSATGDLNGAITKDIKEKKFSTFELLSVLASFKGEYKQIPPMYSAIKIKGTSLYKLAKEGKNIERKSRQVTIFKISLIEYDYPIAKIIVKCSKGTYIRQLAEDIGLLLNSKACLYRLRRLSSGPFHIDSAIKLKTLICKAKDDDLALAKLLISPDLALLELPQLNLSEDDANKLNQGQRLNIKNQTKPGLIRLYDHRGSFFAVGEASEDGLLKTKRILNV